MSKKRNQQMQQHHERLIEGIDDMLLKHVPVDPERPGGRKQPRLRNLLDQARRALATPIGDLTVSEDPDGFPTSTPGNGSPGGGKGGRSTMTIEDPDDELDPGGVEVPVTSVERAVFAIEGGVSAGVRSAVQLDQLFGEISSQLRHIDSAAMRLSAALIRFEALRDKADDEAGPQCYVASVMHHLPWDRAWEPVVATQFDGVLAKPWPEPHRVCRWVYDFTRRHERIPTRDELLQYLERGLVRVSA